uniref:Protein kinase domain-containing protein n=1 Tax=Timema tahoe TaxID=61484 RepID=A0A7R9IQZ9_9NEOP|nr:unnamed protein product [Timema tahoe]
MQYAKNGDVFEYMLKNGALDEDLARYWFRQLSLALQYLHKLGITHRDLKCENALITEKYNVKLSDFSFARYTFDNKGAPALSNTFCGSFPYISPEIIRGRLYDPKCADVWALGVLLFIMLNKSLPYSESNMKKLYEKQMKQDWHFRSKRAPLLSEEVKYLVRRMLTPKCSNRLDIDSVVNSDWVMKDSNIKILAPDEQKALDEAITLRSDKSYIQSSTGPMTARKKVKVDGAQIEKEGETEWKREERQRSGGTGGDSGNSWSLLESSRSSILHGPSLYSTSLWAGLPLHSDSRPVFSQWYGVLE